MSVEIYKKFVKGKELKNLIDLPDNYLIKKWK
jgi:hypothetical protein